MQPVHCKRCGATLRALAGVHQPGEPRISTDINGAYIRCPKCGDINRDLTPARLNETPQAEAG